MNILKPRRTTAVFAIGAFVLGVSAALAGDGKAPVGAPADDPLAALLAKSGYFAVPIDTTVPQRLIVHGHINDHPARLLLDTAANKSHLFRHVVDALKLPTRVDGPAPSISAYQAGVKPSVTATIEMLKFGEARAPHCLVDVNDQWVGADPALIRRIPFQGLIGDNILTPNQALIDIANAELYLRRPGAAPADVTDEVAAYFKAERYVQVPCTKPKNGVPYVRCTIGGHELSFILDTGAWSVMVDHAAGERIGFKGAPLPTGKGPFTPPGGKAMTFGPLPAPLLLPGGLELQAHNTLIGCDLSALNRGLAQLNLPRADGLLGVNVLQLFSAVIDYARPEPRLFLIDPFVRDGRLLDGEWAGEAAEVSGKPVPAEEVKNYRLTIWGDGFDLRLGTGRRLDLEIDLMGPNPGLRTLDLLSKGPGEKRAYPAIYEVSHGRLRVCLPLEVKPGEKVEEPKAFKSAPDSPYAVLTFRRVRAK